MQLYDPTAQVQARHSVRARAPASHEGLTIGLLSNGKFNAELLLRETRWLRALALALSGEAEASTRIRLAKTQNVIAVAKMSDGSFFMDKQPVKVTIGGCGG